LRGYFLCHFCPAAGSDTDGVAEDVHTSLNSHLFSSTHLPFLLSEVLNVVG
jgi:hypothetical protein